MQTATKIPDFQPIFNILLPKCVCLRGFASDPTWGLPAPPAGKRWVSPLQRAPQNCGPQGPETPRSATAYPCPVCVASGVDRYMIAFFNSSIFCESFGSTWCSFRSLRGLSMHLELGLIGFFLPIFIVDISLDILF